MATKNEACAREISPGVLGWWRRSSLVLAVVFSFFDARAEVILYPGPSSLDGFQNLTESNRYAVKVNGKPLFVYSSRNRTGADVTGKPIPKGYIDEAHFCYFSFADEPVEIEVQLPEGANPEQVTLHPLRHRIKVAPGKRSVRIVLTEPRKLVLKTTPEEKSPLILLTDRPDHEIPEGKDVTRFGPGIHDIGMQWRVHDGQTIYLDGGAIVKGTFYKPKSEGPLRNFTVKGRGILYGGDFEFRARRAGWGRGLMGWEGGLINGLIAGIILLDGVHWNTGFANSESVFDNLKIIAWHGNTDGIRVGANSVGRDCFVMCNDDALLPEGEFPKGTHGLIEGCVVWHHAWGRPFKIINFTRPESDGLHHFTYRNIDVLETGIGNAPVFLSPQSSGDERRPRGPTHDILFEDIYIERAKTLFELRPPIGNQFRNVTFRNIHAPVANGVIDGWSDKEKVERVRIENLVVEGKTISSLEQTEIKVGPFAEGIEVVAP